MDHRFTIYLIRHGETPSNRQKRYLGWRDEEMSERGRTQIMTLKKQLPALQKVYTSDLKRCREAAGILSPVNEPSSMLREYNFGVFDGCTYEDLKENEDYQQWLNNMESVTPPGGESFTAFKNRVLFFVAKLLDTHCLNEPIGIVTHGGVVRTLLHHWSTVSESMWDWPVAPGEAYEILLGS